MNLSSLQLAAFVEVAKCKSFSKAAQALNLTQSALSQRILNLESELQTTLLIRETKTLRLTEVGDRLLRYCLAKDSLEQEFINSLRSNNELAGVVKIGSFSTYTRSVLIPQLAPFLRQHPKVQIEIISKEMRELPSLLYSGQVQYLFVTEKIDKQGIHCQQVGSEENILIESSKYTTHSQTFIDHDEFDTTTRDYFRLQMKPVKSYSRAYFDEIYAIIEAVEQGLGRAVVPKHLVQGNAKLRVVPRQKSLRVPIYFCYFEQAFMGNLAKQVVGLLAGQ